MNYLSLLLSILACLLARPTLGYEDDRRELQTLLEKWNIANPILRNDRTTMFLDFVVSDFVQQGMFNYSLWATNQCQDGGVAVEANTLFDSISSLPTSQGSGSGARTVTLTLGTNSNAIADSNIYTENTVDGTLFATLDFCVRFQLLNALDGSMREVNYLETLVTLLVDLTDGFDIANVLIQPLERLEKNATQTYEVEGFPCDSEGNEIQEADSLNPGEAVNVCVRPTPQAIEDGITMDVVEWFDFFKIDDEGNMFRQEAIKDQLVSTNGLTTGLVCTDAKCKFETLVSAAFYSEILGSPAPSAAPTGFNEYAYCAQFSDVEILEFRSAHNDYDDPEIDVIDMTRQLYDLAVSGVPINFNDDQQTCTNADNPNCYTFNHPTCTLPNPTASRDVGYTITFSNSVAGATSGCCSCNSCVAAYLDTPSVVLNAGDTFSYTYKATGGGDWYEAAIVLYQGTAPATLSTPIIETRVVRGQSISEYKTESFTIPSDGEYFLGFFTASYDRTGGTALGASMTVVAFSYRENPFVAIGEDAPEPSAAPTFDGEIIPTQAPTPEFCREYSYGRRYLEEKERDVREERQRQLQIAMSIQGEGVATLKIGSGRRRLVKVATAGGLRNDRGRSLQAETGQQASWEVEFLVIPPPERSSGATCQVLLGFLASSFLWGSLMFT